MAHPGWGRQSSSQYHLNPDSDPDGNVEATEDDFSYGNAISGRPAFRGSATSQDTIRATPPIDIPTPEATSIGDGAHKESFIDQYMRTRQPSVSFNSEVVLESGQTQSMDIPLEKPPKDWARGRSLVAAMNEMKRVSIRSHSESEREHYDLMTGRHLPRYSSSPAREQAKLGEGRFPILQSTVDAMARETGRDLPENMSLTTESTISPVEEVHTPRDEQAIMAPAGSSPFAPSAAFSYEEPKTFHRTASQRWRDSEGQNNAQDFFSRAGSLAKGRTFSSTSRLSRSGTNQAGSFRSPRSAASSYLRGFSVSSSNSGDDTSSNPAAVDAEGQTIGEDYVIGKQIGWGGFSTIKEVTQIHSSTQRKLAVKIVRRQIDNKTSAENDQAQAEFEHEVELWRFLDHPHILPLEAVYKLEEATFCFIPLNTGGTLFDVVRGNRQGLPPVLAQSYVYQLASALRYLHLDARVVHRDIKLENCLLDVDPRNADGPGLLRVCDFGMAEWLSREEDNNRAFGGGSDPPSPLANDADRPPQKHIGPADTSTSAFAGGSLEYAAPELMRIADSMSSSRNDSDDGLTMPSISIERAIVSPGVDLWAFGVCVYSLVVGNRPFQNSFQPRVVMAILAGDWDRDRLQEKGGDAANELVEGCLEMEEDARWDIQRVLNSRWLDEMSDQWEGLREDSNRWKL